MQEFIEEPKCVKCGSDVVTRSYIPEQFEVNYFGERVSGNKEKIKVTCYVCDYYWYMKTKDSI